jgi:hypothetical protein
MKRNYGLLFLLSILVFTACQKERNTGFDKTGLDIPRKDREILDFIADVEAFRDTMQQRGPLSFERDGANIQVTGYFHGDDAMLIQAQLANKELWYYLKDNKVVLLREITLDQPDSSAFTERQYFYNETALLDQRMRTAPSLDSLKNSTFRELSIDSTDMRVNPDAVTGAAMGYMYGY